jgi:serine/threonine protein kinase
MANLGLRIRANTSSPLKDGEPIFKGRLGHGESLQRIVFGDNVHQSYVYFVMKDATVKKIRKVVVNTRETEAAYDGAGNEITIYNALKKKEGWKQYILPFEKSERESKTVVLEFDYVPGMDMLEYVTQMKPSRAKKEELLAQARKALEFCHRHNVLHGDIKPDNFYVSADGNHCFLFDFGNGYMEEDIDPDAFAYELRQMDAMVRRVLGHGQGGGGHRGQSRRRRRGRANRTRRQRRIK